MANDLPPLLFAATTLGRGGQYDLPADVVHSFRRLGERTSSRRGLLCIYDSDHNEDRRLANMCQMIDSDATQQGQDSVLRSTTDHMRFFSLPSCPGTAQAADPCRSREPYIEDVSMPTRIIPRLCY